MAVGVRLDRCVSQKKISKTFFSIFHFSLGKIAGDEEEYSGKIKIPNFSEEFTIKEVDIDISTKGSSNGDKHLKQLLKSQGVPVFRKKLETYLKELKEGLWEFLSLISMLD
jgi:Activator of Hsp90 ATPase, N-terminal